MDRQCWDMLYSSPFSPLNIEIPPPCVASSPSQASKNHWVWGRGGLSSWAGELCYLLPACLPPFSGPLHIQTVVSSIFTLVVVWHRKAPNDCASKTAHHSSIITHSFANLEKMLQSVQLCFVLPGVHVIQTNFSPSIFLILTEFYSKGQQKYTHLSYLICPHIIYFRVRAHPWNHRFHHSWYASWSILIPPVLPEQPSFTEA